MLFLEKIEKRSSWPDIFSVHSASSRRIELKVRMECSKGSYLMPWKFGYCSLTSSYRDSKLLAWQLSLENAQAKFGTFFVTPRFRQKIPATWRSFQVRCAEGRRPAEISAPPQPSHGFRPTEQNILGCSLILEGELNHHSQSPPSLFDSFKTLNIASLRYNRIGQNRWSNEQ